MMSEIIHIIQNHAQIFYATGFFGEIVMFFLVVYQLTGKYIELIVFVGGFFANTLLNYVLKQTFQEPRPDNPIPFLAEEKFFKGSYGLPSGHAQSVFYSITYICLFIKKWNVVTIGSLIIGILTILERYVFRNHTVKQLGAGILVGIAVGYLAHMLSLSV
jgi:membrane-associated phospholipid phosphatase